MGRGAPDDTRAGPPVTTLGPGGRNRYVDLVRLVAILVVVGGHWLNTMVLAVDGELVGQSALAEVGYMRWLTLLLQVMPMFFLAAGYSAAASWPTWVHRSGRWPGWAHARLFRVLRPTSWYVAIMACLFAVAVRLGVDPAVLAQAGWAVALQLWFLPVYMLLILLAVPMLAAWNRAHWSLLAGAVLLVAGVDLLVRVFDVRVVGWASYLLAPGAGFLLGIAWHSGALAHRAARWALLGVGALAWLALVVLFGYPPWMVGVPGEPSSNTSPPNLALMAYSATQIGVVLLLEPALRGWLERPRAWAVVVGGNRVVMSLYLWHMVPVVLLAGFILAADLPAGPQPGSPAWWAARLLWVAALAVLLAGVVGLVGRLERPSPPCVGLAGPGRSALLLGAVALTGYALSRLAVGGFTPSGHLAVGPLTVFGVGALALWLAGRPGPSG